MKQFLSQYYKEFSANFNTVNAYIILACYNVLSFFCALYLGDFFLRESDTINSYFVMQPFVLTLIIPAVTMRSWADEIKSGTIELLLTQPMSYFKLVLAKFLASLSFFVVMVLFSIPFFILTYRLSIVDIQCALLGYMGLLLCGILFSALGCLVSVCNRNNILSYLTAIFVILFVTQIQFDSITLNSGVLSLRYLSFEYNYGAFLSGIFQFGNLAYFLFLTLVVLWLNIALLIQRTSVSFLEKKFFHIFIVLLLAFLFSGILGVGLTFTRPFDVTMDHKFTLTPESQKFLENIEKRIDIVLYESKEQREDINSSYAVYASFVERILNLIERISHGAVRSEFIRIEPFSAKERALLKRKIPFEEDKQGHKTYMVADISDNDGNSLTIPAFSNLRQNLLESDFLRLLRLFGAPRRKVALIADAGLYGYISYFQGIIQEFYDVDAYQSQPIFIHPQYDAVIVINPLSYSTEFLLAMEQYVLNGGNLLLFHEPELINNSLGQSLKKFLRYYGIDPVLGENVTIEYDNESYTLGAAFPQDLPFLKGIRSVIINDSGALQIKSDGEYTVSPILTFNDKIIGAVSSGKYFSAYPELVLESEQIIPASIKPGKLFFFYDSDLLQDYLYVSEESKGKSFYETVPTADNVLFFLRLLDYATDTNIESLLSYRHYAVNVSSIGQALLKSAQDRHATKINALQEEISVYTKKQQALSEILVQHGPSFIKNLGDANDIAQKIDEKQDELNRIRTFVHNDYMLFITTVTVFVIIIFPFIFIAIMFCILKLLNRRKMQKIRRLMQDA